MTYYKTPSAFEHSWQHTRTSKIGEPRDTTDTVQLGLTSQCQADSNATNTCGPMMLDKGVCHRRALLRFCQTTTTIYYNHLTLVAPQTNINTRGVNA